MPTSVLFVCLGNICRSPLAEAALREECKLQSVPMVIDSAGTSDWHAGQAPDERAQKVAAKNGVEIDHLRGRVVSANDFRDFDHIVALDAQNLKNLEELRPSDGRAQLSMLSDYIDGRKGEDIADPYYGKEDGFDITWNEVTEAARSIVRELK
ncbi:MAG: low molecular weight protein-tyrosine-phosphatase [Parasphingorhabdus sp.]